MLDYLRKQTWDKFKDQILNFWATFALFPFLLACLLFLWLLVCILIRCQHFLQGLRGDIDVLKINIGSMFERIDLSHCSFNLI